MQNPFSSPAPAAGTFDLGHGLTLHVSTDGSRRFAGDLAVTLSTGEDLCDLESEQYGYVHGYIAGVMTLLGELSREQVALDPLRLRKVIDDVVKSLESGMPR